MNDKALIVGAGVAGPVTAMALQRAGIDATIYEAYPNTAYGVGAFMGLAANGLDALSALELRDPVRAVSVPTPRMAVLNGAGRTLAEIANGLTLPDGTSNLTVRRADLYQALHDEAVRRGVPIEYGKRLVSVEQAAGGVVARFADGSEASGSFLIGADGMRSKVRDLVDPGASKPEYAGIVGTGGYAHGVRVDARPDTMYFVFCKRAFFGYQAVSDDEVWWFANVPRSTEDTTTEVPLEETKRRLLPLFADDTIPAVKIIEASTETATWLPMHSMAAPVNWHRERMVLVGDAAHVTSPSSGQGASMAMEDAVTLARCLRDMPDLTEAFTAYQRLREDRVHRVYTNAKKVNANKAAGPVGRVFRDLLAPVFMKRMAKPEAIQWLHGHHIDFDERVAA